MPDPHCAIVLAAGGSRRLGRPKQLLEIDGESLLVRAVNAALGTAPCELFVALGAEIDACTRALGHLPVRTVKVPQWAQGMGTSLATTVAAVANPRCAILVLGVDQPALDAAYLQRLVRVWQEDPSAPVASAYADTLGTPAIFPSQFRMHLAALSGDRGASMLLRQHAAVRSVSAPQLALDIDTAEDWTRITRQS